ncbi:MAG: hypothetical protein ABI162_16645 [Luteolibacter sp.]
MKYRPSKSFVYLMVTFCPITVALIFGLLPELPGMAARPIPGEITFSSEKPTSPTTTSVSARESSSSQRSTEWFEKGYENLMKWDYNPWKRNSGWPGEHFFGLHNSKDPLDQAKYHDLRRLADAWQQKLLLRFPDLAIAMKTVPDDQNGFLKWLDLLDKIKAAKPESVPGIDFPKELDEYINHQGSWNADATKAWLAQQKSLVDEIHAIGLLPEQSVNGIPIDRWGFFAARFGKNCAEIMTLEARVAAEQGDVAAALESVRAAKGLADHLSEVETSSALANTVKIIMQLNLEYHVLNDIIPALPAGQVDPAVWESAVNPTVSGPAEFARLVKSQWSVINRYYILPPLLDAEDPKSPPDGGELLDHFALDSLEIVRLLETANIHDFPTLQFPPMPDTSHLSWSSRQFTENLEGSWDGYRKGWVCSQSKFAMTQAAFAIMQGRPIPQDPIYGQDYRWNPVTRELSPPSGKTFDDMKIKPITVPKL